MTTSVHPTALVHRDARLGVGVEIGPWTEVGASEIGDGSVIGANAVIGDGVSLGREVRVGHGSLIGTAGRGATSVLAPVEPSGESRPVRVAIGDETIIRSYTRIEAAPSESRGESAGRVGDDLTATERASEQTVIGRRCHIMSYVIVGAACRIGDLVAVANGTQLGTAAQIGDQVGISGLVVVWPAIRIGRLAFVGGLSEVREHIPPFMLVAGKRAEIAGLNSVGLRRAGLSSAVTRELKAAYRLLFLNGADPRAALSRTSTELQARGPEVDELLAFLAVVDGRVASKRGGARRSGAIETIGGGPKSTGPL